MKLILSYKRSMMHCAEILEKHLQQTMQRRRKIYVKGKIINTRRHWKSLRRRLLQKKTRKSSNLDTRLRLCNLKSKVISNTRGCIMRRHKKVKILFCLLKHFKMRTKSASLPWIHLGKWLESVSRMFRIPNIAINKIQRTSKIDAENN